MTKYYYSLVVEADSLDHADAVIKEICTNDSSPHNFKMFDHDYEIEYIGVGGD